MKRLAVALAVLLIYPPGSNNVGRAQQIDHEMKSNAKSDSSHPRHDKKGSAVTKIKADTTVAGKVVAPQVASSIKEIVQRYVQLKNSLVADKSNEAAAAGKEMVDAMGKLDKSRFIADQKKLYEDVEDDAREHAEHIGANADNIKHQREHFDLLSKDMYDLVKVFGSGQVLYKDFCPMYNGKKGAMWLSETKAIKNPYYGKQMPTCGSVQEELK